MAGKPTYEESLQRVKELEQEAAERKRAEEALRETEQLLSTTLKSIGDAVIATDAKGLLTLMNPVAEYLTGWDEAEAVGKPLEEVFNIINEQTGERVENPVYRVLREGAVVGLANDTVLIARDGTKRPIADNGAPIRDEQGDIIGTVMVFRDITERKRAEKALQESEERLSAFMESATDGFILYDSKLNVLEANGAAAKILNLNRENLIGKHIIALAPNVKKEGRYDKYMEVLKTGEPFFIGDLVPHRKFGDIHLAVKAFKVSDGLGIIFTDITEYRQVEEALEKSYKELQMAQDQLVHHEKLAVLGQMAGGVGHELRNPLGVMSNAVYYLNTILSGADETTREYLEIISSEVSNADKIVSDLLDFSHVKPAEREETALSELVVQVLEKQQAPENVEVTTTIPPDLPAVFVDPGKIDQVLGNLITNAYQAISDGGRLAVRAREEPDKVSLSITDTGCGISKENMKNIFEPLFTTRARGIGLGLAVSRSLVETNGGSIKVESEEGKGSTFTLILPTREVVS